MVESSEEQSAANQVYEWVRAAIIDGRLVAGERYSIYWLSDELGFSRTPVREAILKLEALGVVEIKRNRGFVVHRLTVQEVRANYEARMMLEVPAARAAALFRDQELIDRLYGYLAHMDTLLAEADTAESLAWDRMLHSEIVRAGKNARIEHLSDSLRDSSIQAWDVYPAEASRRPTMARQHYDIVDAIAEGDADRAGRAMQYHLENSALVLMRHTAASAGEELPEHFQGNLIPYPDAPRVEAAHTLM